MGFNSGFKGLNCYAGTSEENGHMKDTPKAAVHSYSQWIATVSG